MNEPANHLLSTQGKMQLPNATATLVLGILSIVVCFICGIVALAISRKDVLLYKDCPDQFDRSSWERLKTGRVCAIIGVVITGLPFLLFLFIVLWNFLHAINLIA